MQEGLSLFGSARQISWNAVLSNLCNMAGHRLPSFDLSLVVIHPSTEKVAAVPLKPASWICGMNPPLLLPIAERLRSIHPEEVERWIMSCSAEPRINEPVRWELGLAICHVTTAEDTEGQHLLGRELREECWIESLSFRLGQGVAVALLHAIMHCDRTRAFAIIR